MMVLLWCIANIMLKLKGNYLGNEGVKYLSEVLKVNTTLTIFKLKGNPELILLLQWITYVECAHRQHSRIWRREIFEWITESKFHSHSIVSVKYAREWISELLFFYWIATHRQRCGRWRSEMFVWIIKSEHHSHSIDYYLYAREWLNFLFCFTNIALNF